MMDLSRDDCERLAALLRRAAAFLDRPVRFSYARAEGSEMVCATSNEARRFCARGAIMRATWELDLSCELEHRAVQMTESALAIVGHPEGISAHHDRNLLGPSRIQRLMREEAASIDFMLAHVR